MERTNFTFVSPSRLIRSALVMLAVVFGAVYASAQCTPPANVTVTPGCDGSVTLSWDPVPAATSYTVDVVDGANLPAVNFVNMPGTSVTIAPGSLVPFTMYSFAVTANCGVSTTASTQGVINAADVYDLPPTIVISNVVNPSCPTTFDGSFDVTVLDACGAFYDISLGATTFFNVAAGTTVNFGGLSGSVAGTTYTVNLQLAAAGGCNYNPACVALVSQTVTLESADATPPLLEVFNPSGAVIPSGSNFTYTAPEGECGVQLIWTIFSFDNCGVPTVTASISNPNPQVIPSAQLVLLNNAPSWALEIYNAIGTNTVTVTSTDADGNATTQTFTINVPDSRLPVIYTPGNMNIEIPSCEADIPVNWTVSVVDDCDINPALVQTGGPVSGSNLTPGTYTVTYQATDDFGNTSTSSFTINVTQAPSPAPIVDVSGNGSYNVPACAANQLVVFSGNVYDCDLLPFNFNPADLTVTTNPLSPGASGAVNISYTLPGDGFVYFEATGFLSAGTYLIVTDYQGVSVDHGVVITQDADQPANIDMPGNLSFLVPACTAGANLSFNVQLSDDCDADLSGAAFTLNGGPAPAIDGAASDPANGLYVWNLTGIPAGNYTLGASYTDGAGNLSTSEVTFVVTGQPDNWAPIIVYPSQDIVVDLDPCAPPTAIVAFEVTAADNCDGIVTPLVTTTGGSAIIDPSVGGDRYVWTGGPGVYTVTISATDAAGNSRTEDFQVVVNQAPAPLAAPVCNDDINVTLNDNCQRVIRADMVLEGELGCFDNDDFVINIVNDDNPSNGNILDGCGQFIYEIDLNALPEINGFNGDYAAVNWLVLEENGSSVDIGATTATLVSSDAGGCSNAEGSMTTTVPNDGTISFDYNYVTSDPVFELHMIQVTAAGVTTDIVDINSSGSGSVNIPVGSGDVLYIAVVSVDCILGPGTATISNFNFQPAAALPGPIDWEPCWGYITGEDKDDPIIECPPSTGTGTIIKNGYTIAGTIDVNDPQVVVNNWSCLIDNTQPNFPGTRYVDVQEFQVSESDIYTFLVQSDVTQTGNVAFAIYQGGYDSDNPCENIIAQADIPQPPGVGNPLPGSQGNDPSVRLALPLQAGATYYIATTTFTPDATGNYQYSICADGNGQVGLFDTTYVTNPDWSVDEIVTFTPYPTAPVTIQVRLHCGDFDLIFNNPASLAITGSPIVSDNCDANPDVTFVDTYTQNGDCDDIVIKRTFTATDEKGNSSSCMQFITLSKVVATTGGDSQVWLPPFTVPIECDEDFPTLPNGHPTPEVAGYPFVFTASGIFDLNDEYCNVGASYEDGAEIVVCDGAFKFIRTWTIVDWCFPTNFFTYPQVIKVGDFTKPVVVCPGEDYDWDGTLDPLVISTSPFSCTASFEVPLPTVTDNCSGWEVYTEIRTTVEVDVTNQYGQVTGTALDTITVRVIEWNAPTRFVSGIPAGNHFFYYVVEDDCGNKTEVNCDFSVRDQIEPVAVCDDQLNISIGGGDFARVFAEDIDEGSWDNCEIDRIEVRRNKFDIINYTCGNGFSNWGPFVDFFCCDVGEEIEIQLRVIDKAGNINTCWLNVTPEEKVRPYCYAPHNVMVDCDELPYDFDPFDTDQLQDLFGAPSADDNCEATAEELPPVVDLECGFGRIIRRFRATDIHGNQSVNFCQQVVDVKEVHNFEIKFPEDAEAICGVADPDSVVYEEIACDLLAVQNTDETFSASGDECYKIFRTWKVINWCQYDGESAPLIIGRDEDCDNNPGDECVWVLHRPNGYTYIDRDDDETEPNNVPLAFQNICQGFDDFWRKVEYDGGYYQYTQIIKVYDDIDPEIIFTEQTFCSYDNVNCDGTVNYPFEVDENCTPDDLTIKVFLDAGADGTIDFNLTATGMFGFTLTGTYPNYTIGGQYPIGCHAFEVHVEDGCGNVDAELLPFCVEDCKAPSPICINGLAIELMPFDVDGDDVPDEGRMGIWASDFIASPISDCTGPVKYSMNRSGEAPNIDSTGIVLTCADTGTLVVEIWAWDGAGNSDFCETYILVQDNMGSCTGAGPGVAGAVETEAGSAVQDVNLDLSGDASATTTNTGEYAFADLVEGYDYTITPQLDEGYLNGVSTFDLVLISQHILGVTPLNSPYKMIAADVNNSESVTTLDLIQLRKLILSIDTEFANNTSWRFVESDYVFPNPANPWVEEFPEVININNLPATGLAGADFVAVKIGDVNLDAETNDLVDVEGRTLNGALAFEVAETALKAGDEYTVAFTAADIAAISGYQATLTFNTSAVELVDIISGIATEEHFGLTYVDEGLITTSWNGKATEGVMFSLVFRASTDAQLSEVLGVSSRITKAEAYDNNGEYMDVNIEFTNGTVASAGFELYQNTPNPFNGETMIGFNLPAAATATLTINDVTGKVLKLIRVDGVKGFNSVVVNAKDLPASGVLYYTVECDNFTATKKMVIVE
jgi:hypothetical protein